MNMTTATGMVVTLHAYALSEIRLAQMREMRRYIRRIAREEMQAWVRENRGKPYDWGGTA